MEALARLVTLHPKKVLLLYALALLVAVPFAAQTPGRLTSSISQMDSSPSRRVAKLLEEHFTESNDNTALLLVQAPSGGAPSEEALARVTERIEAIGSIKEVTDATPFLPHQKSQLGALISAELPEEGSKTVREIRAAAAALRAEGIAEVRVTGAQAVSDDFAHYAEEDTKRSEIAALPLIALVLLLVFGALMASALPIVVGGVSIALAMAVIYWFTGWFEVATFAQSVVTMLGLGAGIDYALLMVNRFREEQKRHATAAEAARAATLTAGRSVLWSGATIGIAMGGLLVPQLSYIQSVGIGGIVTVLCTILVSVTLLPAILTLLGERVNSPRRWAWCADRLAENSVGWSRRARAVMQRPWLWTLLGSGLLLLMASPLASAKFGHGGAWGLSRGIESRDALDELIKMDMGGLLSQFEIVLQPKDGLYNSEKHAAAFAQLSDELRAIDGVKTVLDPFVSVDQLGEVSGWNIFAVNVFLNERTFSKDGQYMRVSLLPDRHLKTSEIRELEQQVQQTLEASPFNYNLGGNAIGEREFSDEVMSALPKVIGAVFLATFAFLLLAFRSLVVPLKSIVLNGLTVAAATGFVAHAIGGSALGNALGLSIQGGIVDAMLPLLLFSVMFGLSMDYEIFLLSRVQEHILKGEDPDEAVVQAVGHTARIITSAALIMFVVFSAFVVGSVVLTKSIGLGLAVAVVLDATLVRLALVPAVMRLAGKWNWWLPEWLDKILPKIDMRH